MDSLTNIITTIPHQKPPLTTKPANMKVKFSMKTDQKSFKMRHARILQACPSLEPFIDENYSLFFTCF